MPETPADINYPNDNGGNYTITADDIQSWQDQYYGVAVKFFKDKLKALNDLVKKKRYLLPKYILYVGGSARSKRLSKDMNELFNEFFPSAKIIGSKQQSADKFAVDGVAMDPINLGISHEQCNTLADDISRSGRPFHYNVTLKFAESDEFLLVVGSGGKTISEVRLQLARDIAGSGRFNFVAWSSTPDLTIIPFKSANGIGGEPIQS
ncbi:hypothetical protein THAR02_11243 [Trichoderma harzianum]|uniref:Uncharacterized protein n=1 Tax=Trichoderma harzianum TaxID=5544 RepID=A0A0F9ZU81_TRIHA|nr:hypothetical protein THAR02_11243 [Trichoderma harzianum]